MDLQMKALALLLSAAEAIVRARMPGPLTATEVMHKPEEAARG